MPAIHTYVKVPNVKYAWPALAVSAPNRWVGLGRIRDTEPASQIQPDGELLYYWGHVRNDGRQLAGRPGADPRKLIGRPLRLTK